MCETAADRLRLVHRASNWTAAATSARLWHAFTTKGANMRWYHYLALFFAGAFLVNSVPHFTNGVSGRPFPSPFASPPGQGLSSPVVNVLWGSFNFIVG